jgi:hypothetical protein
LRNLLITLGFIGILLVACKKEDSTIGKNSINSDELLLSNAIDTFEIITTTEFEDSLVSSNNATALLGSYNDPIFGKVESEIFTQIRLSNLSPDFGDISTITVDSFVLGLEYKGYYGKLEPQTFEVFQLKESLYLDSTYYSFQTKKTYEIDLMDPLKKELTPNPTDNIIINSASVSPQLRLYLDTNIAKNIISTSKNSPSIFSTNESFNDYFKGLNIRVNNPSQSEGSGAILYFNLTAPLSKLTIYYHQDTLSKTFDFLINSYCADFNHVTVENSNKKPGQIISNPSMGQEEFYSQAYFSRAVVKIPHLDKIPKNSVIQYAKLELPVSFYSLDLFVPSSQISTSFKLNSSNNQLYDLNSLGDYSDFTKSYIVDLKSYIQNVNLNLHDNIGLYFAPTKIVNSSERIVFNGSNSIYKKKPKLYIIYTTF